MSKRTIKAIISQSLEEIYEVGFKAGKVEWEAENKKLKKAVKDAAEILHNMPHAEDKKIDKEIEAAWDILDYARR